MDLGRPTAARLQGAPTIHAREAASSDRESWRAAVPALALLPPRAADSRS